MPQLPETRKSLLVRLADSDDQSAWEEFRLAYEPTVYGYCRSHGLQCDDALDVVQEVLVVLLAKVAEWQFTGRRKSFRLWLMRTTHRLCLKSIRERPKSSRGGTSHLLYLQNAESAKAPPSSTRDLDWQRWAFGWAAERVRSETKRVQWDSFWLTAVKRLPPDDVATKLGIRVGTVYTNKCRVMAKIRVRVQQLLEVEE